MHWASSWWRRCLSVLAVYGVSFRRNGNWRTGTLTLAALVVVTAIAFGSPAHYWYTALPLGMLLPALLAAYCRPVFAAAAALILGFAVVWTTTFGIGDFGEPPSLHDRAYAGRATLLAISTCTLVLAALFAERRHKEAALKDSNDRLADGLAAGEVIAFEWNAITASRSAATMPVSFLATSRMGFRGQTNFSRACIRRIANASRDMHTRPWSPAIRPYDLSFRFCCVDGRQVWLEERARGEFDTVRQALAHQGPDARRHRTQTGQSCVAERLVSIVESCDDAIVSKDLDGVIVSWNQGAERLFGYSADEAIGKPIVILVPSDVKNEQATYPRSASGGRPHRPLRNGPSSQGRNLD